MWAQKRQEKHNNYKISDAFKIFHFAQKKIKAKIGPEAWIVANAPQNGIYRPSRHALTINEAVVTHFFIYICKYFLRFWI